MKKSRVEKGFSEFYEKWMCQLEQHLQNLEKVSESSSSTEKQEKDPLHKAVVSAVTAHHKNYYTVKWAAAHEDVVAFFSPVWASPLERAYSWITDWKPSVVFQVIESLRRRPGPQGAMELTEEQARRIEELRVKIRMEEEKVEREMERQQVALADRKMVELARLAAKINNNISSQGGEASCHHHHQMDLADQAALKGLLAGLERVMKAGDCVRLKTLKVVLEILTPLHCVRFLAAMSLLLLHIRQCGSNPSPPALQIHYSNAAQPHKSCSLSN